MLRTRFTDLVNCRVPIQQAPIGGCAVPRLAAAVANAGGMGMVTVTGEAPDDVAAILEDARRRAAEPIGANFFMVMVDRATLPDCVAAAAERARVVDFFYADPDPALVAIVHAAGGLASWQVGSAEEARAAADAGCDLIVAQGIEAGGHVRGRLGLLALLDAVLPIVDVPVLASGGIGTGRAMAAALAAGADGVRVGTRFVAAEEAEAHPDYVEALIAAGPDDTAYSNTFTRDHPDAPHRALRSSIEAAHAFAGEIVGEQVLDDAGGHRADLSLAETDDHASGSRRDCGDAALGRRVRARRSTAGAGRGDRAGIGGRRRAAVAAVGQRHGPPVIDRRAARFALHTIVAASSDPTALNDDIGVARTQVGDRAATAPIASDSPANAQVPHASIAAAAGLAAIRQVSAYGMIDKPFSPLVPSSHSPPVGDGWRSGRVDRGRSPDGERPAGDERMTKSSGATKGSPMHGRQVIDRRERDAAKHVTSVQWGLNEGADNRR